MIAHGPSVKICVAGELLDQASDNKDRNLGHVTDSSADSSCFLSPGISKKLHETNTPC